MLFTCISWANWWCGVPDLWPTTFCHNTIRIWSGNHGSTALSLSLNRMCRVGRSIRELRKSVQCPSKFERTDYGSQRKLIKSPIDHTIIFALPIKIFFRIEIFPKSSICWGVRNCCPSSSTSSSQAESLTAVAQSLRKLSIVVTYTLPSWIDHALDWCNADTSIRSAFTVGANVAKW